jgi:hypothetical protein
MMNQLKKEKERALIGHSFAASPSTDRLSTPTTAQPISNIMLNGHDNTPFDTGTYRWCMKGYKYTSWYFPSEKYWRNISHMYTSPTTFNPDTKVYPCHKLFRELFDPSTHDIADYINALLQHGGDNSVHVYNMARFFYTGAFAINEVATACRNRTTFNPVYPWKPLSPHTDLVTLCRWLEDLIWDFLQRYSKPMTPDSVEAQLRQFVLPSKDFSSLLILHDRIFSIWLHADNPSANKLCTAIGDAIGRRDPNLRQRYELQLQLKYSLSLNRTLSWMFVELYVTKLCETKTIQLVTTIITIVKLVIVFVIVIVFGYML